MWEENERFTVLGVRISNCVQDITLHVIILLKVYVGQVCCIFLNDL
jgi:hypothetical protein